LILLVSSNKDIASPNIVQQLLKDYDFKRTEDFQANPSYTIQIDGKQVKLVTLNNEMVLAQKITDYFTGLELVIFISRHSSESGTPTLSVHTPGNLAEAGLGGIPRKVSISPANAMRDALKAMMKQKTEVHLDYEVSYEGTHHGPCLDVPTMFCELGSSIEQWNDLKAARAVGHAAIEAVARFGDFPAKAVLGIGGTHYNSKFTCIALESEVAFGHMIPKYAIPNAKTEMIKQCIERTLEKVEYAVLDWKGIKGEHKQPIVDILEGLGLPFEKV
jgi:D-aminoacyl-tRNA deacylase